MRKQVYQKRRARLRSLLIFCTAAAILLALLLRTDRLIRPELCAVCESETKQFAAGLMADSVSEVLQQEQFQYSDFAALTYDNSGNVTAVETKTNQINHLQTAIYQSVQHNLEQCRDASLTVSLGTASGVWLFAGHSSPSACRSRLGKTNQRSGIRRCQPDLPHDPGRDHCRDTGSHPIFRGNRCCHI